jgi:hypothetical protein
MEKTSCRAFPAPWLPSSTDGWRVCLARIPSTTSVDYATSDGSAHEGVVTDSTAIRRILGYLDLSPLEKPHPSRAAPRPSSADSTTPSIIRSLRGRA